MKRESFEVSQEGLSRVDVGEPETQDSRGLQGWLQHDADTRLNFKGLSGHLNQAV